MAREAPDFSGCTMALAAVLATAAWAIAGAGVLWKLDLNPWWSAFCAVAALGLLGFSWMAAALLTRAAAARFVERIEEEGLAATKEEAIEQARKAVEELTASLQEHQAKLEAAEPASAPGGDA